MGAPPGFNLFNNEVFQIVVLVILMALLAIFSARQATLARTLALAKGQQKIYVIEVCGSNEFKREYREGDYVGKIVGDCENEGKKVIKAIYVEELQQPKERRGLFRI